MDFRVLGPLEVWSDGTRVALPSTRHQRLLAALLLAPNAAVPVSKLVEALWEDEPPTTATKQVQNCVSTLRERLGHAGSPVIVTDGPGYRAKIAEPQLDLLRFRRGLDRARRLAAANRLGEAVVEARQALQLWRGPVLDGIGTTVLASRAANLTEQRLSAIEQCVDWQLIVGQHGDVVEELCEVVAEHPLRERPYALLMRALDRVGRPADALSVFHQVRERLVAEFGIEPSAEVRRTYEQILCGEPEPAGAEPADARTTLEPADTDEAPDYRLNRAVRDLATAVCRQWSVEAEMRSLNRRPVRVTWSATSRPVTAADNAGPCPRGDIASVVSGFRQTPARQLVVLGEPGAGKTVMAILLTVGLLTDPLPGEPVPVLLSMASWRPHEEHLHSWMARMLVREYPGLANTGAYGHDAATRLVVDRRIMPVLDGLDEMPAGCQAPAIDALDRCAADSRPFVLTCRAAAYEHAVRQAEVVLSGATVVEIEPVELAAAIAFLTAREPRCASRWTPVVAHLREQPSGALAQALRTPLMVDLARAAYADPATNPAELRDTTRFADRATYEQHLLDNYLPAAYTYRPAPPDQHRRPPRPPYDQQRAERWLTFLARHLRHADTQDLAWWRLDRAVPPVVRALLLGLPPAVVFVLAGWTAAGPMVGLVYGLSFALGGCLAHGCGNRPGPRRVELTFRGTTGRFLARSSIGAVIGVGLGLGWSLPWGMVLLLTLVFALGVGPHAWLDVPVDANRVTRPATVFTHDLVAALWLSASFGLSLGVFYGMAFAFTKEMRFITIWDGRFDLVTALAAGLAATLLGRFLRGVPGSIAYGVAGTIAGGLVFPRATTFSTALVVGVIFGIAVGLSVFLSRASGTFVACLLWMALRRQVPLRLVRFLEDAHQRGVLRQVGAVYQFRHARLANRLALAGGHRIRTGRGS